MRLATLQFEMKLQNYIRMGITIFKMFIRGGISLDIRLIITFYGSLASRRKTKFPMYISDDIPPQMNSLNSYSLIELLSHQNPLMAYYCQTSKLEDQPARRN